MDGKRFQDAYHKLQALDERWTYKIRPRSGALHRLSTDQLEERYRELAEYSIGLKEVLHDLFQAIAGRPAESPTSE
jgi:hypothetical protein